jgi:cytochrome b involved in lipid metabolism
MWAFNIKNNIYVKIDNHWFDLTDYKTHPGGQEILKKYHCRNATEFFNNIKGHHDTYVESILEKRVITNIFLVKYLNLMEQK